MEQTARIDHSELPSPFHTAAVVPDNGGIAELTRVFWRRKMLLLGTITLVTALSVFTAFQITPRYTASARMMVHPEKQMGGMSGLSALGGMGGSVQGLLQSVRSQIYGEIEVLRSHRLIEKVVLKLGLTNDPEFNKALQSGIFSSLSEVGPFAWFMELFGPTDEDAPTTAPKAGSHELRRVVELFRERMEVRPPGISNVVNIAFNSENPEKAAKIANVLTEFYIADHMDRKFQSNVQVQKWLDDRLSTLRKTMTDSEQSVAEFLAAHKLSIDGRSPVAEQQFAQLNQEMMEAKTRHEEKQGRFEQVLKQSQKPGGLLSIKEVRNSNVILRLREQESVLVRRAAEYETRFGERHPRMINIRAEISNVRTRITEEEERIVGELRNELNFSKKQLANLNTEMAKLEISRSSLNQDQVKLHQMKREAAADRTLYEVFLARFKEVKQQETLNNNQVEIIAPALVPLTATFPRKDLIISFGFMVSIAIGVFIILLLERLDNGFRTKSQVERLMNTIVLGSVPKPTGEHKRVNSISELVTKESSSPYVEAIRSIRTSLMVSNIDRPPKVLLVASAMAAEGKTSLAVSIARLAAVSAMDGRVMLIDGDLRRPAVAPEMGLKAVKGLIHYFSGQAPLEDIIVEDPLTGVHAILAAPGTPNPPELLNSTHMRALLDKLSRTYDTIVIDSPALSEVSDALVLAHLADATIYVVQWETTPRHIAIESFKHLLAASAQIAGVVLQKVNTRKSASYGYEES